jgi:HEAT repeat protein
VLRRQAILTGVLALFLAIPSLAQTPGAAPASRQEKWLRIWSEQLAEAGTSAKTKRQAAELLLDQASAPANKILLDFLSAKNAQAAKVAIAEAIAKSGGGARSEFIEPLMSLMTGPDETIRAAAGRALLTYRDDGVTEALIAVLLDARRETAVRRDVMGVVQHMLDKRVVDALISLLRDKDAAISQAALEALPKLTNIYGYDAEQWERWWRANRDKPLPELLAGWAENLAKRNRQLEEENARLRQRLGKAVRDAYERVPAAEKSGFVLSLLGDEIADVQLVGLEILGRSAPEQVSDELKGQVRALLASADARLRASAAIAAANLGDDGAVGPLIERLDAEAAPVVRQAVLQAMGQLRAAEALPVVLKYVSAKEDEVAAAAAVALEKIAAKHAIEGQVNGEAVQALLDRYKAAPQPPDRPAEAVALLEALLRAMGAVGSGDFLPVVGSALQDPAAVIRLAAVNSLGRLGNGGSAGALVPLLGDADPGIRRAALTVIGALGGAQYLEAILARTKPAAEPDAAVRQQAWGVTMDVLKTADADAHWKAAEALRGRENALEWRLRVLELLLTRMKEDRDKRLPEAHRQLGLALLQADRPGEAAEQLKQAHALMVEANRPDAQAVWLEHIEALLRSDPSAAVQATTAQEDDAAFAKAYEKTNDRLTRLKNERQWDQLIALARTAAEGLAPRLTAEQLAELRKLQAEAIEQRDMAVRERVARLAGDLAAGDAATRQAAAAAIRELGPPAVPALLEQLRALVDGAAANPDGERAIVELLGKMAPGLKGYDLDGEASARLAQIEQWLADLQ